MKFSDYNISDSLKSGLRDLQFVEPTPIQEQSIPIVLEGKDLIGTAQTGTGKTGAFVIPIMENVLKSNRDGIKALILSPTRELATQIDEQIFAIGYHAGISSATVIGGSDFSQQAKALKAGVDIIVATPGRLIDQKKVLNIDFSKLDFLVLDEADRMLDMGFLPDMKKIISWLPENRQTLLFSATMPNEIKHLASSIMKNPESIAIERSKPSQSVEQRAYRLKSDQKVSLVKKIFNDLEWDSCIIFTSTKKGTDELQRLLKKEGIKAASIHGDRSQDERNKALQAFKNGTFPVIVATDVLARGIDIKGVSIILNYDVPNSTDDYIHRIGRTGRYDKSGIAITFVTRRDSRTFSHIEKIKDNKLKVISLPESFDDNSVFSWDEELKGGSGSDKNQKKEKKDNRQKNQNKKDQRGKDKRQDKSRDQKKSRGNDQSEEKQKPQKDNHQKHSRDDNRGKRKDSEKQESGRDKKKSDRSDKHSGKQHDNKKQKQHDQSRDKEQEKAKAEEKVVIPPVIERAAERNKRSRKPAKGFWGIIKSFIPKF